MLKTKFFQFIRSNGLRINCRLKMSASEEVGVNSNWRGVPLSEVYGSSSPWGAPEFPLVSPAFNHAVLYHISSNGTEIGDRPPKPQVGHEKWDHDYVRLPCSSQSVYPVTDNGETVWKKRWLLIIDALSQPIEDSEQLANAILSYNTKFKTSWKFRALHSLFNEHLEEEESQYFFSVTLPEMAKLALALPKLVQAPIPLLRQHKNRSLSLSQQQIASLLANAFFCTFPRRNSYKSTSEYASFPHINFTTLYESSGDSVLEKLKCICHYFRRITTKVPVGVMTFIRRSVPPKDCPKWEEANTCIAGTPLQVNSQGTIEDDGVGLIQVDFANKYLGGGVLNRGCVQEEIRFVICPELMVSMLFTQVLRPTEALLMIGCERYSKYSGYGYGFRWAGDYRDETPYDSSGRRRCAVLAIDALPFAKQSQQYRCEAIVREMNKAWVGMSVCTSPDDAGLARPGVATGNWGCGAFGGTPHLKFLLQLMAAAEAKRPMVYYTFSDVELRNDLIQMYNLLAKHNVTVGQLCKYIKAFANSSVNKSQLYPYLQQTLIDRKNVEEVEMMDMSEEFEEHTTPPLPEVPENVATKNITDSPDMFSQESVTKVSSQSTPKQNVIRSSTEDQVGSQTQRLFNEMDKLDETSGKLNLSESEQKVQSRSGIETKHETSDVNSSLEMKKKIGKKITDYFSRKT